MLKLYGGIPSRASIVRWYLEEMAIPYEFVLLDLQSGEHCQPEFLAINPMGKVPTIVDGEFKLWESGAILLYLAEKHGKMPTSLEEKSIVTQWVIFANATLATGLFVEASRAKETPKLLTPLNQIFAQQSFILGDEFTVADVAVGSVLVYVNTMLKPDLSDYPAVVAYIAKISQRSAFQKAMAAKTT